jgi:hypothetical protein
VVGSDTGPAMSENLRLASAVAELGMLLRDSEHKGKASFDAVIERGRFEPELVAPAAKARGL